MRHALVTDSVNVGFSTEWRGVIDIFSTLVYQRTEHPVDRGTFRICFHKAGFQKKAIPEMSRRITMARVMKTSLGFMLLFFYYKYLFAQEAINSPTY